MEEPTQAIRRSLQQVQDTLDAAPPAPCSPGTVSQNRAMIDDIVKQMITKGQLAPPSALDQLEELASHMNDLPPPSASQPPNPQERDIALEAIDAIKRYVRTPNQEVDIDDMYKGFQTSMDGISTPTTSQPRSEDAQQRYSKHFEDLCRELKRKKIAPPNPKRKRKGKVRSEPPKLRLPTLNAFISAKTSYLTSRLPRQRHRLPRQPTRMLKR